MTKQKKQSTEAAVREIRVPASFELRAWTSGRAP